MVDKNQEGYADPTAAKAIRKLGGSRIDYSTFKTYEELREYMRFCSFTYPARNTCCQSKC